MENLNSKNKNIKRGGSLKSRLVKIRPQEKINHFAFQISNIIIEEII